MGKNSEDSQDELAKNDIIEEYGFFYINISVCRDKVVAMLIYEFFDSTVYVHNHQEHQSKSLVDVLLYYFPKIRNLKKLVLTNESDSEDVFISDAVGELLLGNCCKKVSSLKFHGYLVRNSMLMKSILTKLPLRELEFMNYQHNVEFSDKLIEGLQLDSLMLLNGGFISLDSLSNLCDRRVPRKLIIGNCKTTLSELGQFFEKYFKDGLDKTKNWMIYVDVGATTAEELRKYFTKLKCFQTCDITVKDNLSICVHLLNKEVIRLFVCK